MQSQCTIAGRVSCTGIGLHSGEPVQLNLLPAAPDSGIVVVRNDDDGRVEIPARAGEVASTVLATTLGRDGRTVGTVEHLLAALHGMGVDNARVVVQGPELPVMDGSAASFVFLIRSAGILRQGEPRRVLRVRKPVEVRDGERWIRVEPSRRLRISYAIDFPHPVVGRQELSLDPADADAFERDVARARTFGFLRDVRALWDAGLARGGTLENTVVLDDERVVTPGGLRWSDEFVRHKVLDLYGDLALLGLPLRGHVRVEKGGHALHIRLVNALIDTPDAWRIEGDVPARRGLGRASRWATSA